MSKSCLTLLKTNQWLLIIFRIKFKLLSMAKKPYNQYPISLSKISQHILPPPPFTKLQLYGLPFYLFIENTSFSPPDAFHLAFLLPKHSSPSFCQSNPSGIMSLIPSKRLSLTLYKASFTLYNITVLFFVAHTIICGILLTDVRFIAQHYHFKLS